MITATDAAWLTRLETAPELRCVRWRIARWCRANLSTEHDTPVKLLTIERALSISHVKARDGLAWCIAHGLVLEAGRDGRRTRSLRLNTL